MARNPDLPEWAALTKVCYRVAMSERADDWDNRQKIGLCIESARMISAELKVIDGEEWLIDLSVPDAEKHGSIFALPLRNENTKEPVWSIMEARSGGPPPIAVPDGVIVAKQPPDGFNEAFPPNAGAGGSWEDEQTCGPLTIICGILPCCWICLCAIGQGKPIDVTIVYVDKDGKKWKESGEPFGKPQQQEMK